MSLTDQPVLRLSIEVNAATEAHRWVDFNGAAPAAGSIAAGPVLVETTQANELAAVTVLGTAKSIAGGVVAKNAELQIGAAGKLIAKAAGKVVARALSAGAADGDEIKVFVIPSHT